MTHTYISQKTPVIEYFHFFEHLTLVCLAWALFCLFLAFFSRAKSGLVVSSVSQMAGLLLTNLLVLLLGKMSTGWGLVGMEDPLTAGAVVGMDDPLTAGAKVGLEGDPGVHRGMATSATNGSSMFSWFCELLIFARWILPTCDPSLPIISWVCSTSPGPPLRSLDDWVSNPLRLLELVLSS